ncbi:hypothetical protein BDN71DRAFT_428600 [Pleurotus eryngii]|uniref:Uncharacterized protein n=1 Tax=Pleurotus eryngii TaxID=5323 RepID=A0A9P5ZJF5_PLEER|nr:hypothetical protein BDN71DRAFT_428600 [Pleurotus eryngii]
MSLAAFTFTTTDSFGYAAAWAHGAQCPPVRPSPIRLFFPIVARSLVNCTDNILIHSFSFRLLVIATATPCFEDPFISFHFHSLYSPCILFYCLSMYLSSLAHIIVSRLFSVANFPNLTTLHTYPHG